MRYKWYYLLIIFLSLLPFIGIFTTSLLPHTSDGVVQIARMGAYFKALHDGHFPVRWAGDLNYGYGMPLFIFIYQTPFLISSALVALGVGLIPAFKIVLWLSFLLSGIFMFGFTNAFFKDARKALLVTILYQFAPFRLVEILVRGSVGGIYAYSFLPLVLWGLVGVFEKKTFFWTFLTAFATMLMIVAHNSLALLFFGIAVLFTFFFGGTNERKLQGILSLIGGLGLSAFFWMPALLEHKFTYGDLFMKDLYKVNFPPFLNFFIPNFTDDARLRVSEISVSFGLIHTLVLISSIFILFMKRIEPFTKKLIIFSFILIGGALFVMIPQSTFLWEKITLLRQFQFPWRLLAVTTVGISFLGVVLFHFKRIKNPWLYIAIIAITVLSTIRYWQPTQGYDKATDKEFWDYPLNTTYFGETDVIWSAGPAKEYPKSRVEVIEGTGTITNFKKITQLHTFDVSSTESARVVDRTQYFPGWRVLVDGKSVPIQFQDANWRGLLTFTVPAGDHHVVVSFGESKVRLLSDIISLITLLGFGGLFSKSIMEIKDRK